MAARPGEDLAATLFADIHYYYGPPTAKPPHHRFDKGSYVYLFENASQRRARLEVANSAGTPDQDAFNGYLDGAHVQYSYTHPSLLTLTVDGPSGQRNSSIPADSQEWHLPTFDPRNEKKYLYRLHTIDVYFWTKEDAVQFLNGVRRVLPPQQLTILDEPAPPQSHVDDMSPVVQKLENVAITDPSYQQGRTRDSRNTSVSTSVSIPPPPPSQEPARGSVSSFNPPAAPPSQDPSGFVPMAYNPAAPAAPEAIKHREKTPPPEDGAGNPLVAAATSDQGQTYGVPYQFPGAGLPGPPSIQPQAVGFPPTHQPPPQGHPPPPQGHPPQPQGYFTGPPRQAAASPPVQPQPVQSPYAQHFQNAFAGPPTSATIPPPAYQTQSPPHAVQSPNYPGSPGFSPAARSQTFPAMPAASAYSPNVAPPGGFAQYNYNPGLSATQAMVPDHSIHQQVYRPTETEATSHYKPVKAPSGKFEARAGQLEKGVGGFLKKLEKRIG